MPTPVLPLEYATPQPILDRHARRVFGQLLMLSILSGLCVGVCFLAMLWGMFGAMLHAAVFVATIVVAVQNGACLPQLSTMDASHRTRMILDTLAGLGLVGIGVAPAVYYILELNTMVWVETVGAGSLGIAYGLLAATTWRHRMLYRFLAEVCRNSNHPTLATRLNRLGWGKVVYEGLWLSCCSLALLLAAGNNLNRALDLDDLALWFAFAALFGAMGFGGIWIWMIVVHAVLYRVARPN